jgi:hypothetical protein
MSIKPPIPTDIFQIPSRRFWILGIHLTPGSAKALHPGLLISRPLWGWFMGKHKAICNELDLAKKSNIEYRSIEYLSIIMNGIVIT